MHAHSTRDKYASMPQDVRDNETHQCDLLAALAKIACAGSGCLQRPNTNFRQWESSECTLCDTASSTGRGDSLYWNEKDVGEDWKDAIAAILVIIKEPKFQESSKARVSMAVVIGRVFSHISDTDYLNLETCELGQWLLGSMSRSLRELKIAATSVHSIRKMTILTK
jgi:serine/threonine-protein kinase ATR